MAACGSKRELHVNCPPPSRTDEDRLWINLQGLAYINEAIDPEDIGLLTVDSFKKGGSIRETNQHRGTCYRPSAAELNLNSGGELAVFVGVAPDLAFQYKTAPPHSDWPTASSDDGSNGSNLLFRVVDKAASDYRVVARLVLSKNKSGPIEIVQFYSLINPREDDICNTELIGIEDVFFPIQLHGGFASKPTARREAWRACVRDFIRKTLSDAGYGHLLHPSYGATDEPCENRQQLCTSTRARAASPNSSPEIMPLPSHSPVTIAQALNSLQPHLVPADDHADVDMMDNSNNTVEVEDDPEEICLRVPLEAMLNVWPDLKPVPRKVDGLTMEVFRSLTHGLIRYWPEQLILLTSHYFVSTFCSKLAAARAVLDNVDLSRVSELVFKATMTSYCQRNRYTTGVDNPEVATLLVEALRKMLYRMLWAGKHFTFEQLEAELGALVPGALSRI